MDDLKLVLMSLSLEKKLLSPLATETGMVNKITEETHILGYRSPMLNFLIKFKIFSSIGFLRFFTNFVMLINSSHRGAPSISESEPTVKAS
jgi:hypothetical protein